jgi:uncharacterized Tic20 family protein
MTSDPTPPPVTPTPAPEGGPGDKTMGMLCHLLGIFVGFLGPLIIWLVKKDQDAFVNDQGKEALNFQITVIIAWFVGGITVPLFGIGCIVLPVVAIGNLVFCIMGAVAANKGENYRYPWALRLIK